MMDIDVQAVLAIIAICVSIVAVAYSASVSKRIASSDHQAAEKVKADIAKLYASITSIAEKQSVQDVLSEGDDLYDIRWEQKVVSDFVNSESAIAYRAWIRDVGGQLNGEWRTFFSFHLRELSHGPLSRISSDRTDDALSLLASLRRRDIEDMVRYSSNLVETMSSDVAAHNVLIEARRAKRGQAKAAEERGALESLLLLRERGVTDPNVEMFIGALTEDAQLVRRALSEGADPSVRLSAVFKKYSDELGGLGG